MGYDVHITRKRDWHDEEGDEISADEWLTFVRQDPALRVDTTHGPHFAIWDKYAGSYDFAWFDWSDGCISTKGPDDEILWKMLAIAKSMGAKVQGDDGEVYSEADLRKNRDSGSPGWLSKLFRRNK